MHDAYMTTTTNQITSRIYRCNGVYVWVVEDAHTVYARGQRLTRFEAECDAESLVADLT